ncbi:hypothetical protein AA12717_1564 [Gluconacetobacter sacchari DSM 12717]|uniref:Glycosyltransferase family 1 protein n=2 Tax=Gluconacetobacter sacchari TaxID=92759 RepID=A0A7W4IEA3_9PROT|nr:glycosyltransferase family 1 protein [Gluconacetobacter sacchari]MBB2161274.1 glycosyltransferase family 1 protein [Gluconacetobacter sacchari]GBQ23683.1 hypothetical protein AA12717_1564 [Gluconacetobacter sacchari DSM 12717]
MTDDSTLYDSIRESGLFDDAAYIAANPDVARSGIDPLLHYIRHGQHETRRLPFPQFDADRYIADFRLETVEGNPFFDLVGRNRYRPDHPTATLSPFEIYLYNLLLHLDLFDEKFYIRTNQDLRNSDLPPLVHYVKYGIHELTRNPNRTYNNQIYLRQFGHEIRPTEPSILHYIRNNLGRDYSDRGLLEKFDRAALALATRRLEQFPFYSDKDYEFLNRDIENSTLLPHQHALLYGLPEGRTIFSKMRIAEILGAKMDATPTYQPAGRPARNLPTPGSLGVFYHTGGNCFIRDIAEDLVSYLRSAGLNATLETEKTPLHAKPELCLFCAPHEFFFLDGAKQWERDDILGSSLMLNTEQPQTPWFSRGLIYLLMSAGVIDFLYQNVEFFESVGIPSFHFDPIPDSAPTSILEKDRVDPLFRVLPDDAKHDPPNGEQRPVAARGIDVSFFGNASARREKFFTRNAAILAERTCFLYYRKQHDPIRMEGASEILARMPFYVAENSKICLNIHRNDDPYFEWHRIIKQGAARGAVVVTEDCLPTPLYRNGVHFLTETPRHMPHLINWLLDTPDGRARAQQIQDACLGLFRDRKLQKSKINDIAGFIGTLWQRTAVDA